MLWLIIMTIYIYYLGKEVVAVGSFRTEEEAVKIPMRIGLGCTFR